MDPYANQGQVRAIYHVSVGVKDIERARRFYDATLAPLGYKLLHEVREGSSEPVSRAQPRHRHAFARELIGALVLVSA